MTEAKDASQFVEKRTCDERYTAGAQLKGAVPGVATAHSSTGVTLNHKGSIVLIHGKWSSNIDALLASTDRALYVELFQKYSASGSDSLKKDGRFALISWVKGFTVVQTTDKDTALALSGGIAAGGSFGFGSADTEVELSYKAGTYLKIDSVDTYLTTSGVVTIDKKDYNVPDLALTELPSYDSVVSRLKQGVSVSREGAWTSAAGSPAALAVTVAGITQKECDSLELAVDAGAVINKIEVNSRTPSTNSCVVKFTTNSIGKITTESITLRAKFMGIELGTVTDDVTVSLAMSAKIGDFVRPQDAPDKQRWKVSLSPSGSVATQPKNAQDLSQSVQFRCPDGVKDFMVTFFPEGPHFETSGVPKDCSATPPKILARAASGTAVSVPVSGSLLVQ